MEKIVELKLSEEDTMKLQRVNYESLRFGENLQFMMENPDKGFSGEQLIEYTQKKAEADMAFDQYRWDLEKKYLPQDIYGKCHYDWEVDFRLCIMKVKFIDEESIVLAEKNGL